MLRVAYWIGIVLDAVAFVQMAFPALGLKMLVSTIAIDPAYVFSIELGAGLMLAWTLLLFWADRKPLERRGVIPLTMIIIAWNLATMLYGVREGLVPARTMLPQIIIAGATFVYYGICFAASQYRYRSRT
jgi:hypothetical protein